MRQRRFPHNPPSLEEPLINLTPLIDVVFVVLIAFMLISPAIYLDHIELAPSVSYNPQKNSDGSSLSIRVKEDNTIWLEGISVSAKTLEEQLKAKKKLCPEIKAQLIQDQRASFGTYQIVKNTLERSGFEEMDLLLGPPQ